MLPALVYRGHKEVQIAAAICPRNESPSAELGRGHQNNLLLPQLYPPVPPAHRQQLWARHRRCVRACVQTAVRHQESQLTTATPSRKLELFFPCTVRFPGM